MKIKQHVLKIEQFLNEQIKQATDAVYTVDSFIEFLTNVNERIVREISQDIESDNNFEKIEYVEPSKYNENVVTLDGVVRYTKSYDSLSYTYKVTMDIRFPYIEVFVPGVPEKKIIRYDDDVYTSKEDEIVESVLRLLSER